MIDSRAEAQPGVYFAESFDDNSAGWTLDGEWEIGPAVASPAAPPCGNGDPGSDADASGVTEGLAGVVIGGAASALLHPVAYLTSPPIDTTGSAQLSLEFDRWLNSDYTPFMNNRVEVFDGMVWVLLWESGPSPAITESEWSHHTLDITSYSGTAVQVRFGMGVGSAGAYTGCGSWNLDNVTLLDGMPPPPPSSTVYLQEFFDDNSAGWTLGTEWEIGAAVASPPGGSCGNGDPASDADGPGGAEGLAGIVIGGSASTAIHPPSYLTSPPLDTTGAPDLSLEFDRWLNSDYTPYMSNRVEVFDGMTWVVLWASGSAPGIAEGAWSHHTFDITPYSGAAIQVRFGFEVGSSGVFSDCGSWNLDNVTIFSGPPPPPPTSGVYLQEPFDDNSAGWTLDTEWQIGPAVASPPSASCGDGDPSSDADGAGGTEGLAGIVIGGGASTVIHPYSYLTSPPVDTTGAAELSLEFDRWLNSDYTPYMNNSVEVFDGVAWVVLWESGPSPSITESAWSHHTFDITSYSNAAVQVRFGLVVGSNGAYSGCGSWNVDNVTIQDGALPPPVGGFVRGGRERGRTDQHRRSRARARLPLQHGAIDLFRCAGRQR